MGRELDMDKQEKDMREKFSRETGKTPEQEGRDSAQMVGVLVILLVGATVVIGAVVAGRALVGY